MHATCSAHHAVLHHDHARATIVNGIQGRAVHSQQPFHSPPLHRLSVLQNMEHKWLHWKRTCVCVLSRHKYMHRVACRPSLAAWVPLLKVLRPTVAI